MVKLNRTTLAASAFLVMSACGQNPSITNGYSQINPYGTNYGTTTMVSPQSIINSAINPNPLANANPFLLVQNAKATIPIYSNHQIVGYRTRTALLGGTSGRVRGGDFSQTVQVNAGDRLVVMLNHASYGASSAVCEGALATLPTRGREAFPLPLKATYNGQEIEDGVFTASAPGSIVVSAQLDPVDVDCGGLFKHREARIISYFVNLSNTGNDATIGSNTIEGEKCTDTQGGVMTCPDLPAQSFFQPF